jgi:Transposase DDE domain
MFYQVCDWYNEKLGWNVQRFSKNGHQGNISDEELMTIYLFNVMEEGQTSLKGMYEHTSYHWSGWFVLPRYQTFVDRLNRLSRAFMDLVEHLMENNSIPPQHLTILLGDSYPIITCSGKRQAKVALDIVDKGYCASKNLWYHGVKLHILAQKIPQSLPYPQMIGVGSASQHDLNFMKPLLEYQNEGEIYLDKAYCDVFLEQALQTQQIYLQTPIKDKKGESEMEKQRNKATKNAINTCIARVRQPIESFFAWVNQKTNLQNASKVRSKNGLMLHIFGKIAVAILILLHKYKISYS